MTFLAPIVLTGLAAVTVPVAIHLLNKMRVKVVKWAATRFLQSAVKKNNRRLEMEDLLLLLLRCLLVALLVLAFARPVLNPGGSTTGIVGEGPYMAVLVVDGSASMGQSNGIETRFDAARSDAQRALSELGPGSQAALFLVTDRVNQLVSRLTPDLALLRQTLGDAKVSDRTSDLAAGIRTAIDTLRPVSGVKKEVLVFTDNQAVAWAQIESLKPLLAESPEVHVRVIPAGNEGEDNLAVTAIRPESLAPAMGQLFGCLVEISNWGSTPASGIRVTLSLNEGPPSDEVVLDSIEPGQVRTARLSVRFPEAGFHTLRASIPPDRLPVDNSRSMALQVVDQVRAVVVEGTPAVQLQDRDGFFLANALAPVPEIRKPDYFMKVQTQPTQWLETADLSREELVFLANVSGLSAEAGEKLKKYVIDGGALVIFPGPDVKPADYNDNAALKDIMPATLLTPKDAGKSGEFLSWQDKDYRHPVTMLWNDPASGSLGSVRVTRRFPMTPATSTGEEAPQVIVAYNDGQPAAMERKAGNGTVVLFGTSATTKWSNFPIHPNFVPFLKRLTGHLSQTRSPASLNLPPGAVFQQTVSPELAGREFQVIRPDADGKSRPAGTVQRMERSGIMRYRDTEETGAYRLLFTGEQRPAAAFAIQMDPAESELRVLSEDRLEFLKSKDGESGGRSSSEGGATGGTRREFWGLLVALAAVAGLAEMALAHKFSLAK